MLAADAFQSLLLLLPLGGGYPNYQSNFIPNNGGNNSVPFKSLTDFEKAIDDNDVSCDANSYNFDQNGDDWEGTCQTGMSQSPIELITMDANLTNAPRIRFNNYNTPLRSPLVMVNNGHSANLDLVPTSERRRASITGGLLPGRFEVQSVHFHWGSRNSQGSEHTINGQRYDVEMHIVHKNARYPTMAEAVANSDGLAVLGILIQSVPFVSRPSRLNAIFDRLPEILDCGDRTNINGRFTVGDLLGSLITGQFFSYNGSLTTPPCSEAVTWTVFTDVIQVAQSQIRKFFQLRDSRGVQLINNYRNIQDLNGRTVYYRNLRNYFIYTKNN